MLKLECNIFMQECAHLLLKFFSRIGVYIYGQFSSPIKKLGNFYFLLILVQLCFQRSQLFKHVTLMEEAFKS